MQTTHTVFVETVSMWAPVATLAPTVTTSAIVAMPTMQNIKLSNQQHRWWLWLWRHWWWWGRWKWQLIIQMMCIVLLMVVLLWLLPKIAQRLLIILNQWLHQLQLWLLHLTIIHSNTNNNNYIDHNIECEHSHFITPCTHLMTTTPTHMTCTLLKHVLLRLWLLLVWRCTIAYDLGPP